ncbi:hypothetical protein [Arthrobacter sp. Leaf141]|uniref:hypothetical protein n=1 Tax=Arthrobacter sp. Leaf141 TaxID=1736273 RepID=UPI001F15BAFD|nr:hypothetical protein [Arthrobacter sp. Leaf141]
MEITPNPIPDTRVSVIKDRSKSFSGAPRCSQIILIPPTMTANTASAKVHGTSSLFTIETTGLAVVPSALARFTVGISTQNVERVVTI